MSAITASQRATLEVLAGEGSDRGGGGGLWTARTIARTRWSEPLPYINAERARYRSMGTVLNRLADAGLVERVGDLTSPYFAITEAGREALAS